MTTLTIPTTTYADGDELPLIGFGTSSLKGRGGADAIAAALGAGYRLIDTAAQYGNEAAVGEAVRTSGVDADQVLVTTKIAGGDQGREAARAGYAESLRRLGASSAHLVLIHWPNPSRGLALDTWRTLIDLKQERSEERRVGKECRSRSSAEQSVKKREGREDGASGEEFTVIDIE